MRLDGQSLGHASSRKLSQLLALVSHEFFHTWNVRRLRPRTLMQYDYEREQYISELWIAEGITSYFDDLALVRCGLCTREEYLQRLSKNIATVRMRRAVRCRASSNHRGIRGSSTTGPTRTVRTHASATTSKACDRLAVGCRDSTSHGADSQLGRSYATAVA